MTAYGALISLENTITDMWKSHDHSPFNEMLKAAYVELQPLQEILGRLDGSSKSKSRKKVNALDGRIKHALWNFEDFLENLLSDIGIHTLSESSCDVERLRQAVDSMIRTLRDMKEEYIHEVENMPEDKGDGDGDEDEAAVISSTSTSVGMKSKMIGLSDQFEQVKYSLTRFWYCSITSDAVVGMAGIGKTALAMKIYEDPQIRRCYDRREWIRVGREYNIDQAIDLAAQLKSNGGERCLIVLDDVWETGVLPVILTEIEGCCTFIQVLITARGRNVTRQVDYIKSPISETVLRFLNEDESKDLLCHKVFGEGQICPPELDKAAAKIAKNCEGLPLMILTVAKSLSRNRDPDYWDDVAEERNSVFTDSYEEISKVLFPSYDYLPQRLKMSFMFMGVFPRDHDIHISKILNMWTAEGWLLDPNKHHSLEVSATKCLEELSMSYNLVLFKPKSRDWFLDNSFNILKTCCLHSSWRHLCRREARKNKFFLVLKKLFDVSSHSQQEEEALVIKGQRGLCLENNLLFGLTEFCSSVKSNCASSVRSLLFFGPYHQYPTPLIGFKLLRELDALQLRFYTFPTQILTLFQLKYLALTCNDHLPSTISKLSKLRVLVIHPHISIVKCHTSPSFIPTQIWDMAELEHIEISGKSLRASNHINTCLRNLSTLVGVNADIGTISELSQRIPNIMKLVVQVELMPYHDTTSTPDLILSSFDSISTLENLETLKFSIMNPVLVRSPLLSRSSSLMLPSELKKLHLSGMGFPWEFMTDAIASLPYLQVLKLRCYAFQGPKWEPQEGSFPRLEYLAIEDSDLVQWKPASGSFPELNHLSLKHCYKLHELDWPSDSRYGKIELVDCNPLAVACANRLPSKHRHSLHIVASDHYHA